MSWRWILVLVALVGAWHWWTHERPVARAAGQLVLGVPMQRDIDPPEMFDPHAEDGTTASKTPTFKLARRARYDLTVRVLRKEIYRLDGGAAIAPVDLAVGWARMSDSAMLEQLSITQMGRFFYWRPKDAATFNVPADALISEVAQIHAIPATREIDDTLRRLRPGQLVTLGGYLVDVVAPGFTWKTSLTRTDTGDGACEIMWIESVALR
ncbi:MAG TPA: hypothetical protein VFC24_09050 [Casimicrobiaceae bacterium]|nr:hypothetical protein [Casimicrobiaceae bacterium]